MDTMMMLVFGAMLCGCGRPPDGLATSGNVLDACPQIWLLPRLRGRHGNNGCSGVGDLGLLGTALERDRSCLGDVKRQASRLHGPVRRQGGKSVSSREIPAAAPKEKMQGCPLAIYPGGP